MTISVLTFAEERYYSFLRAAAVRQTYDCNLLRRGVIGAKNDPHTLLSHFLNYKGYEPIALTVLCLFDVNYLIARRTFKRSLIDYLDFRIVGNSVTAKRTFVCLIAHKLREELCAPVHHEVKEGIVYHCCDLFLIRQILRNITFSGSS